MNLEVSLFADGTHKLKVLEMIALYLHIGDRATLCHVL